MEISDWFFIPRLFNTFADVAIPDVNEFSGTLADADDPYSFAKINAEGKSTTQRQCLWNCAGKPFKDNSIETNEPTLKSNTRF